MIGPYVSLTAGMVPGQRCVTDPVVRIGDRCLIGRNSGIVGHLSIVIEDDVWTGHHVYITDQNHDYRDLTRPISAQSMPERPVRVGAGSWLGHGTVVLPGADIGRHVVVGANSVVRGQLPDNCVAAGNPARDQTAVMKASWTAIVSMRATERQRGSGQRRPAWPGNARVNGHSACVAERSESAVNGCAGSSWRGRGTQRRERPTAAQAFMAWPGTPPTRYVRSIGGAHEGISLSPAKRANLSLIGMPSTAASWNASSRPWRSTAVYSRRFPMYVR